MLIWEGRVPQRRLEEWWTEGKRASEALDSCNRFME